MRGCLSVLFLGWIFLIFGRDLPVGGEPTCEHTYKDTRDFNRKTKKLGIIGTFNEKFVSP